jgi:hypothetical protein
MANCHKHGQWKQKSEGEEKEEAGGCMEENIIKRSCPVRWVINDETEVDKN